MQILHFDGAQDWMLLRVVVVIGCELVVSKQQVWNLECLTFRLLQLLLLERLYSGGWLRHSRFSGKSVF